MDKYANNKKKYKIHKLKDFFWIELLNEKECSNVAIIPILDEKQYLLIDSSCSEVIIDALIELNIMISQIKAIINTHLDFFHYKNNTIFNHAIKILHKSDREILRIENHLYPYFNSVKFVSDNEKIYDVRIYHFPGHSKDSIIIVYKEVVFFGDSFFYIGIPNLHKTGSYIELYKSYKRIYELKLLNKIAFPSHGRFGFLIKDRIKNAIIDIKSEL